MISMPSLIIILVIVVLLFGTKRLKSIGSDLGGALKGFKKAVKDGEETKKNAAENNASSNIIEGEVFKEEVIKEEAVKEQMVQEKEANKTK